MKTKIILSILFLLGFNFLSVFATSEEARREANYQARALQDKGWQIRYVYDDGALNVGDSYTYSSTFYAGNTYALIASGCNSARDVDVAVYDGNGDRVAKDDDVSKTAIVYFTPRYSETFYIRITMYDAVDSYAHWCSVYGWTN